MRGEKKYQVGARIRYHQLFRPARNNAFHRTWRQSGQSCMGEAEKQRFEVKGVGYHAQPDKERTHALNLTTCQCAGMRARSQISEG